MPLELTNLTKKKVSKVFFDRLLAKFWRVLKMRPRTVSIVLVGDKKIRELNNQYRQKNKITDVLSFTYNDKNLLGEIAICLPQIRRQARRDKVSFEGELKKMTNHSLLHLAGYDHEKPGDAKKMFALAEKLTAKRSSRAKR